MQRPHVVQPIGQLHQQHADVTADRQHQLAEILRLLGAIGLQLQAGKLGDAVDQPGDLAAEPGLDLGQLDRRVLDHVMQQARRDRGGIQPVARQDIGHREWMRDVGFAVVTGLRPVGVARQRIGRVDQAGVRLGIVCPQLVAQQHRGRQRGRACRGINRHAFGRKQGGDARPRHSAPFAPRCHARLPAAAAAQLRLDRSLEVLGRHFFAFDGQGRRLFLGRHVLQAEYILIGRDQVQHFLVRRLRLRRTRQRLNQILLDLAEFDRLVRDLAQARRPGSCRCPGRS